MALIRLFNDTRKRLVETGTRNRLVHVNRANTRGNVVNIVNERSDDVHAILSGRKAMRFLAIGHDRDDSSDGIHLADAATEDFEPDRYTDSQLETRMGPDALQKRLLKVAREAQTAEEESGVNILYLALGFLTWFEDKSSAVAREAPLVLLPVELIRNHRTSTYDLRIRDEDILTNLPLQQRLKDDFGIELPDIEVDDEWKPSTYFRQIVEIVAARINWKVDHDGMQLGFFSFSKLLMYRDLAIDAWPDGAIAEHDLTRGLLFEGFESEDPLFGPDDRLDEVLPPEKLFHVVDADASQARVIEEVRSGRNLVVQGPPGTGKSQTITNIIAAAAKEGKRVLFIAEKMAALSVVHDRLVKVGLRDVCLELHSRSANKKAVLAELARTIGAAAATPALPDAPIALTEARDKLNMFADVLHRPIGTTGETAFSALGLQVRYIGASAPAPTITGDGLAQMTREQERQLRETITRYGKLLQEEGDADLHPFAGTQNLDLQPLDLTRLAGLLETAHFAVIALEEAVRSSAETLNTTIPISIESAAGVADLLNRLDGLPGGAADTALLFLSVSDLPRLKKSIEAGAAWRSAKDAAEQTFVETAFTTPTTALRGPLVAGTRSFFARLGGAYRAASRELAGLLRGALPKTADRRVELVDHLDGVGSRKARWEDDKDYCIRVLGDVWHGETTDLGRLLAIAAWCERVGSAELNCSHDSLLALAQQPDLVVKMQRVLREAAPTTRRGVDEVVRVLKLDPNVFGEFGLEKADLGAVAARLGAMASSTDRYAAWTNLTRLHDRLVSTGVADLADRMRAGEFDEAAATVELRFARAERLWRVALDSSPVLRDIGLEKRHELVETFALLERKRLSENVTSILAGHLAQVPQGAMGEMKVIRGEIGKKRGHIAVRKLFSNAGTAVQRIKPVLLMSPISVAQYLPPGALTFDLLVIDEASQVRPEDALGAIARANQIVVVGDQKQLPPSSFFDRLLDDEAIDDADEEGEEDLLGGAAKLGSMESILSLCEARGLGSRMLRWHYRSRDPSLIRMSNREFYDDGLILPPSPLQNDPAFGLCFTRVDGVYDKGGKRDNRKEGEAIVGRVAEHARMHPELSLGIVTFSSTQKNLITELLELARRGDATLDAFLREGQAEDLFVKNIENVQGDERDVILVSVCYGPATPGGRLASMTFGPVNMEGGERRLNVLFTRARVRCEVFASFDPGDIDPSRVSREGARILKRFLEFAKNGNIDDTKLTGETADSPFEEDVADVIRSFGYLADPQVGSAGFRIDMGIRHPDRPGTYILAVECDGASYHSALWARERDRLRQDVLEHLGWRFHRIWSTDWFYNRRAEIERLRIALNAAREAAEAGVNIEGANRARPISNVAVDASAALFEVLEPVARQMPVYQRAHFPVSFRQEPHEVAVSVLADLAKRIVAAEGPINIEEAARRVATCFGKEKAGSRILTATRSALIQAQLSDRDLLSDEDFWFTRERSLVPPVRDRSTESGATLKATNISMLEIKAALRIARDDNAGGADADLIRTAARLLGFRRVGSDLQTRLAAGLSEID
ncbi:ATP-dependent RecD-like DNA helicase [Paraburkholderia sediminicola]|uniref:ATP-dependent RecD-like DNA helicase n=2 Tax=Paraburkholderia sediminicola TaxID=458836 RepID=A0A6J5A5T9_9BURK|nr:ATP-dependent RecD-like DNA helicase [Paraburkholderia sediminicola]